MYQINITRLYYSRNWICFYLFFFIYALNMNSLYHTDLESVGFSVSYPGISPSTTLNIMSSTTIGWQMNARHDCPMRKQQTRGWRKQCRNWFNWRFHQAVSSGDYTTSCVPQVTFPRSLPRLEADTDFVSNTTTHIHTNIVWYTVLWANI